MARPSRSAPVAHVADDGPGLPPAERAKVCQRFYRIDRSRAGSGLGLALFAAIAALHGASIALHNNGSGLRVSLTFYR